MSPNHSSQSDMDCNTLEEFIADYAFGLTSPEENRRIEASLTSCPDAAAQLLDFQRIQDEMRASVPQLDPPAALANRLMTAVAQSTATPQGAQAPKPTAKAPWRRVSPLVWLSAAALIALVITNVYWFTRVNDLTQRQDLLASELQNRDSNALVVANTDVLRWVRLPSQAAENSTAVLMWNAESKIGLLYVRALPALEPGNQYQLWLTRGEVRVSAGTFTVDEQGNASLLFHIDDPIDNYTWARVTAEPASGSTVPSGTVVAAGEL